MRELLIVSKYEIIISDTAAEQLENCVLFIAKDNSEAAEKLRIKLMDIMVPGNEAKASKFIVNVVY